MSDQDEYYIGLLTNHAGWLWSQGHFNRANEICTVRDFLKKELQALRKTGPFPKTGAAGFEVFKGGQTGARA
jgi:hypothetical protein